MLKRRQESEKRQLLLSRFFLELLLKKLLLSRTKGKKGKTPDVERKYWWRQPLSGFALIIQFVQIWSLKRRTTTLTTTSSSTTTKPISASSLCSLRLHWMLMTWGARASRAKMRISDIICSLCIYWHWYFGLCVYTFLFMFEEVQITIHIQAYNIYVRRNCRWRCKEIGNDLTHWRCPLSSCWWCWYARNCQARQGTLGYNPDNKQSTIIKKLST